MQISIQVDDAALHQHHHHHLHHLPTSPQQQPRSIFCARARHLLARLSLLNVLTVAALCTLLFGAAFLCKTHLRGVLLWLEAQDAAVIALCVCALFTLVALPVSVGYIVLVVADGYLFGMRNGLALSVFGANAGLCVAHHLLKLVAHHRRIRAIGDHEMTKAVMRVIAGPLCFKIVVCARLTPIPFGLQNTIFALSNVNTKIYHIASFIGLLPAQTLAVYVGTTLRSMQDVIENRNLSTSTYVLASFQLLMGGSLMLWIGTKARKELLKALSEGYMELGNDNNMDAGSGVTSGVRKKRKNYQK